MEPHEISLGVEAQSITGEDVVSFEQVVQRLLLVNERVVLLLRRLCERAPCDVDWSGIQEAVHCLNAHHELMRRILRST